ncbi:hypothetical protein CNMCM7691_002767 [Aspergillus felis]|uniref:Amidase domain-containing protein n=1 Tax=Aspergillus felis TaxID=1287682 RepID=A0A8H6R1S2_9EURO|nr:hypothetical protein CNMCM7691_002767 [Aspergillus felis]
MVGWPLGYNGRSLTDYVKDGDRSAVQLVRLADDEGWPWGFFIYRTVYTPESDHVWSACLEKIDRYVHWEIDHVDGDRYAGAEDHGFPERLVHEGYKNVILEDKERWDGASIEQIREDFKNLVASRGGEIWEVVPRYTVCLVIDQHSLDSIVNTFEEPAESKHWGGPRMGFITMVDPISSPNGTKGCQCVFPSLIEATTAELQEGLTNGCFSSVDLVNAYVTRINEVNSTLHMVLEINPDAWDIARQLDLERKHGLIRGPLHGLPILVKGNIGTEDKMETAAGSYALVGAKVAADSTVAKKLRQAGAVILGKTSMSEWANFRSLIESSGWNAQGGQTYAAYYPKQDPSGSSSGSGVAADLGLAFAAIGTETSGSILSPGENNNIVGIKPTVGLTSRYMVIPISERQDTIGPMARTVKDAAIILQAIAGPDQNDNYTLASPFGNRLPNYVAACKLSGLKGKRIGIPRNVINTLDASSEPIVSAFEAAVSVISKAGATIVDDANFTGYDAYLNSSIPEAVVAADFISNIASYLSKLKTNPNNLHNLEDIRRFTQQSPLEDYPSRDTGIWDRALASGLNNTSPEFWPLHLQNLYYGEEGGLTGALSRHKLDAVILPTALASEIPGIIGSPAITVPLGSFPKGTPIEYNPRGNLVEKAPGIPFGISFLGPRWSEESLIGMAYAFEQRTLVRKKLQRYIEPRSDLSSIL